jgi:uncharacterized protein
MPFLGSEKPTVPRKMIGTLTLSISNSVHKTTSLMLLYKLCSVAVSEHSEPLTLENYVRVVALAPDVRIVPFYGAMEFLHHSSTIELLSLLILIKRSYLSLRVSLITILEIVISLVAVQDYG